MPEPNRVTCDGCGQPATPEHTARRLQRLEWSTRHRPVHINTLLLRAISPDLDNDFLYSPSEIFSGESLIWLAVAGIDRTGKTAAAVHAEFQRAGFLLAHVLECPWEHGQPGEELHSLLDRRIRSTVTRIRRSFRPKRVALVSSELTPFVNSFSAEQLQCGVILDGARPFPLEVESDRKELANLREALAPELGVR